MTKSKRRNISITEPVLNIKVKFLFFDRKDIPKKYKKHIDDNCFGKAFESGLIIIIKDDESFLENIEGTLAHEISHVLLSVFEVFGIKVSGEYSEFFCYYLQYFLGKAMKKYKESF